MSESNESERDADQNEQDMLSMFASVWVKVEVGGDESSPSYDNAQDSDGVKRKKKKKQAQRSKKTLNCDVCEYSTIYKNCLELHIQGHNNSKPFSCEACDYTTKYPSSLQRHMLIQHELKTIESKLEEYKCDACPYTTYFKWNLTAHKRKHKSEKQFKCDKCTYETAYRHNFLKHSKVHNKQEVIFKCDKCPFVTKFEGHITRHLAVIHNEVSEKANRCDLCDFSTKVKWRLNIHKRRSRQNSVLKCTFCEFETSYMCESKKHKLKHYSEIDSYKSNENSNDVAVELPDFEPQANSSFDTDLTSPEKSKNYMLDPNCEVDWNNIKVIESSSKERPFQCIMCKYTSRFKATVQRHFQRHHTGSQNRPFKCCNCDFSTKTKDQIALHNKRSQSAIELHCRECKFTTVYKCQFVMHQKCHYAHKCNECSYACKHKYEIQKHILTVHLGQGMQCRFCDYKSTRKESLSCHETIHTGYKPFKCGYCDYKSVRRSLLVNHMKRRHSDMIEKLVIVDDSKIDSLKIPVKEGLCTQSLIQDIREQNISLEDIFGSQNTKGISEIMDSTQNENTDIV